MGTHCARHWRCRFEEKDLEWQLGAFERASRVAKRPINTQSAFLFFMCFERVEPCRKAITYCGKAVIKPTFGKKPS
jgi:hypothetical protein